MKKSNEFEVVGYYRTTNVYRVDPSKCAKEVDLTTKIHRVAFGFVAFVAAAAVTATSFLM